MVRAERHQFWQSLDGTLRPRGYHSCPDYSTGEVTYGTFELASSGSVRRIAGDFGGRRAHSLE